MPGIALPTIPTADVASHNTSESCYVTVGAHVYDVTSFLNDHPGGCALILEYGGKDVSEIMQDESSHEHSEVAHEILHKNLIGFMATKSVLKSAVDHNKPDDILPLLPNEAGKKAISTNGAAKSDTSTKHIFQTTGLSSPEDLTKETDETADFREHSFLDLRKPLLMQVWRGNFSKEFYLEQVHRPRYYKGGESAPLFGHPLLEPLSKTKWWIVPLVWWPCVAYGTWKANTGIANAWVTGGYWLIGLALWTLVEYGLHRGLFHVDK